MEDLEAVGVVAVAVDVVRDCVLIVCPVEEFGYEAEAFNVSEEAAKDAASLS